ncbi:MAG TPA: helix-turn-helix domain-containing protein [Acidimicrobiales bacterium]|nr:helix-turn-helix domain-containing protein [Acidimicrobiales bacterium]
MINSPHRFGAGSELPPAVWVGVAARLRQARRAVGLEPSDAARAIEVSVEDLLALESAHPDRFADRADALCCLYSYCSLLGLPAERFVDDVVAGWEMVSAGAPPTADDTAAVPAVRPATPAARPAAARATEAAAAESWWEPPGEATGQLPAVVDEPTSSLPALPPRQRRLRSAVAATGVAVVLASAGVLGVQVWAAPSAPASKAAASAPAPAASLLTQQSSGWSSASYSLATAGFVIRVTDPSRPCWLQIRSDAGSWAGVLQPGASAMVRADRTATVELGAGGATVEVRSGSHHQQLHPQEAPYTLTFQAG